VHEWNPQQYLRFKNERTQPSIDLVARISKDNPKTIIDIGCGPGNSTQILKNRWPDSEITGVDSSCTMIEKARRDYPGQQWEINNVITMDVDRKYDIVFSNAVLQWVPNHDVILPRLFAMLNQEGVLAVQIPSNNESPFFKAMLKTARNEKWKEATSGCEDLMTYHRPEYYYNIVVCFTNSIELWETTYYHRMKSHKDLTDWHKSTGLKPFLDRLRHDEEREEFEQEIRKECLAAYPVQSGGSILYPFKRLFLVAKKMSV
jgi:trans-aconitate 2-methyltransferase